MSSTAPELEDAFFRHAFGRLVATLTRRYGAARLQQIEDAAQSALLAGLNTWSHQGLPDAPLAWLHRVAHNAYLGDARRNARTESLTATRTSDLEGPTAMDDDLLHMLFVCCDERIPVESQLVLALRTLCGFDAREVAARLLTTEANVRKRHTRALESLRSRPRPPANTEAHDEPYGLRTELSARELERRLPAVQLVLYLVHTEGYLSAQPHAAVRAELCRESIRLTSMLAEDPVGATPSTFALLALMHLHTARLPGRTSAAGDLLLLEEQDRALWDRDQIAEGLVWLEKSATGDQFTRYHAEAGVAAEHALAPSFRATRWDRIVACYALVDAHAASPMYTLNRAVAIAELDGPAAGLAVLRAGPDSSRLNDSYLHAAVLADLHHRNGDLKQAALLRERAYAKAPTPHVRALLERRLRWLEAKDG